MHDHPFIFLVRLRFPVNLAMNSSISGYRARLLAYHVLFAKTPTFWTQRGVAKSLPPCSRKPHGVPSFRLSLIVIIDMVNVCRSDCRTQRQIKLRPRSLAPHKTTRHCQDPPACPTRQICSEQTTASSAMLNSRQKLS